eukprot:767131-Hanusia_phi.AAC.1
MCNFAKQEQVVLSVARAIHCARLRALMRDGEERIRETRDTGRSKTSGKHAEGTVVRVQGAV